jgi:uncharacterized membrane protein YphA (DoxX/SURF4 family)
MRYTTLNRSDESVTMNAALWTAQVLWGVFFSLNGFGKVLCLKPALWTQGLQEVPCFAAVPLELFIFIGICEFLGGIGLILPALTGSDRGSRRMLPPV